MNQQLEQALERLNRLTNWEQKPLGIRQNLDAMSALMRELRYPNRAFPAIHITGTKGKGSVAFLIDCFLVSKGLTTGRYTSPHVVEVNERVSLSGRDVSDSALAEALEAAMHAVDNRSQDPDPSWFDVLTATAFFLFRDAQINILICEVGMGGRLDSTNVIDAPVSVITNIGLEHTEVLGHTRSAIAREKAGIIKRGASVVTAVAADDEVGLVIAEVAKRVGARLEFIMPGSSPSETNARLAAAAIRAAANCDIVPREFRTIEANDLPTTIGLPARDEVFKVMRNGAYATITLDGAHVDFAVRGAVDAAVRRSGEPLTLILGLAADKNAEAIFSALRDKAIATLTCVGFSSPRARKPDELAAMARRHLKCPIYVVEAPSAAIEGALQSMDESDKHILVVGSFMLASDVRPLVATLSRNGGRAC